VKTKFVLSDQLHVNQIWPKLKTNKQTKNHAAGEGHEKMQACKPGLDRAWPLEQTQ